MSTSTDPSKASAVAAPSNEELIQQAVAKFTNTAMMWHRDKTADRLYHYMDEYTAIISYYSRATLRRLHQEFTPSELNFLADSIITHEETEDFINDLILLKDQMGDDLGAPGRRSLYLRGISHYEHIAPQVDGSYPARRLAQATAVLRITGHLRREGVKNHGLREEGGAKMFAYIADERIRTMLTTHEDPEALAELIISRGLTTSEDIKAVLLTMTGISPALRTGSL
jgi:hypothetical protein